MSPKLLVTHVPETSAQCPFAMVREDCVECRLQAPIQDTADITEYHKCPLDGYDPCPVLASMS